MELSNSADILDVQLILLAVEGDLEARQTLAGLMRNLRSQERKNEAKLLADKYFEALSNSE